jgi:putative OPT family oligopeptide transporter
MKRKQGLGKHVYEPIPEGQKFASYVPAVESPAEFTFKALISGVIFGILFGAANAYLGLRVGLTISTSIPISVMTVAAFRLLQIVGGRSTILESNMSQTIGSASSSVASGVIFTLPALFLWNLDPTFLQMTFLGMMGGVLGTLFMIPLRQFLIEREHGKLAYPEGTACAEVLVASQIGGSQARNVFLGLGVGAFFKFITAWIRAIPSDLHFKIPFLKKADVGVELSAALFGVGYILGPRVGAVMVGGGLLSSLVIIPAIAYWGEGRTEPYFPETIKRISEMTPSELWSRYVRYIGAGAVATAGIFTLIRSIPTMIASFRVGAKQFRDQLEKKELKTQRTSRDIPLFVIGLGGVIVILLLTIFPHAFGHLDNFLIRFIGSILIAILAFFFVVVSSRIVGLVGVTSNPTSGMTIASLLVTSTVFLLLGWTDDAGKAAALTVGCVVAIAASIAGDTSQDLKTGFILGATPLKQQWGQLIGVLTSAGFVCAAVIMLDRTYGFGTKELSAPQATLMKLVIEGVLQSSLPWTLVAIGAGITIIVELLRLPSLAFAVGVYLPVSTMVPIFLGGLLRYTMERTSKSKEEAAERRERGILFGSGLVGGEGLLGVAIAAVAFYYKRRPEGIGPEWAGDAAPLIGLAALALLAVVFVRICKRP